LTSRFRYLEGVSDELVERFLPKAVSLFMPELRHASL
jgi:hypothetical protein